MAGKVYLDGRRLARTAPFDDVQISTGDHEIKVIHEATGATYTETIVVYPNEPFTIEPPFKAAAGPGQLEAPETGRTTAPLTAPTTPAPQPADDNPWGPR